MVRLDLELAFDTGDTARGRLVFVQPEARRRLVDYLNDCPQFFCLRDGDQVHMVNKTRIARISLLSPPKADRAPGRGPPTS